MMFNLFKKNVNMKEVGQNKALTWSCYGVKSRITSIMEGKWTDNGTIVCSDWCGHSNGCNRALGITGTALRKIAAVFCLLMAVGVGEMWGSSYTFPAGTTIYYDFTAVSGIVHWYDGVTDLNNKYDASGGGTIKAVTFESNTTWADNYWVAKTQTGNYAGIVFTSFPESGQNVIKINAAGTGYTWGTAAVALTGEMNSWSTTTNTSTSGVIEVELDAHTTYGFKMAYKGEGGDTYIAMSDARISSSISNYDCTWNGGDNIYLMTAGAGTYTFTYNLTTNQLSVEYPSVTHPSMDYCYLQNYSWSSTYLELYSSNDSHPTKAWPGQQLHSTAVTTIGGVSVYYCAIGSNYTTIQFDDGGSNVTGYKTPTYGKYINNTNSTWDWNSFSGYTITLNNEATTLTAPSNPSVEFNGTAPSAITPPTRTGYTFGGYYSESGGNGLQVIAADGTWNASVAGYTDGSKRWIHEGGTATLYARWGREFTLVSSSDLPLDDEDEVVILNTYLTKALSTTQKENNRDATTDFSFSNNKLIVPDVTSMQVITIEKENTNYRFQVDIDCYLYAAGSGSGKNYLKTNKKTTAAGNEVWSISIDGSHVATITAQGENTNNLLKNYGDLFSCYSSGQTAIKLYRCTSPYLYVTSADLTEFKCVEGFGASFAQAVSVKGYNLTGDVTVHCPTGYELSSTSLYSGFSSEDLTLTAVSNKVDATFYIRLKDSEDGDFDGPLTIDGGGIAPKSIDLDGTVYAVGVGEMGYKLLTDANDIFPEDEIVIMNEAGDQILSTSGSSSSPEVRYSTTTGFTFAGTAVKVSSDDVQVITIEGTHDEWKFGTGSSKYLYTGASSNELKNNTWTYASKANAIWNISINNSNGVATVKANKEETSSTNKNWLLYNYNSGTNPRFACYHSAQTSNPKLYAKPSATANVCGWPSGLTGFTTKSGTASDAQSFSVKARNISSGNVTVTAPTGYEVCLTEDGTYTSSVTITPVSNSVAPTTVYVRIASATGAGDCNGNIAISATGATTRNIALKGTVTPLTVTYHSVTESDHVVNVSYNGNVDVYSPADCTGKVFIGWSTTEIAALQQTAPSVNATGAIANVTEDVELYAVFASQNGFGALDYADDFNGYETSSSYNSATPKNYGIWSVRYGTVSGIDDVMSRMKSKAIVLEYDAGGAAMTTIRKIPNFTGIECKICSKDISLGYAIEYSSDSSSWSVLKSTTSTANLVYPYALPKTPSIVGPVDAYVRIRIVSDGSSSHRIYIDDVTLRSKPHDWILTDYSTTCSKPATVSVSFNKDGGTGDVPSSPAIGESITLPALTKANHRFGGYAVQESGQDEEPDTYYAGESFLVNHDVTLTAEWTRYIDDVAGVLPITSGKDIGTRAINVDSIVVHSATAGTPTATISGTDAGLFAVNVDNANKRVAADGKTHFPYYVTYTPTEHGATHEVNVTFTCDGIESNAITVRGRSLPEEFVIAIKNGDKWVALPSDLDSTQTAQKSIQALEITVDNSTTPTKALYAPANTAYKTTGRYTPANTTCLRFTNADSRYLRVSGTESTYQMWMSKTGGTGTEDWQLKSTDFGVYELSIPSNSHPTKKMGLYNVTPTYMGYHTSPTNADIYLLPIETQAALCNAGDSVWTEKAVSLKLESEMDADGATAIIGGTSTDATTLSKIDGTHYTAVFPDDINFADKNGQAMTLVWKNNGSAVGGSYLTIPSIITTTETSWGSITPTPTLDNIVVLKRPMIVSTNGVAKYVVLDQSGSNTGSLDIPAGKELIAAKTIRKFDGSVIGATDDEDIIIHSDKTHGLGALVMGQHDGSNYATVHFYSTSHYDASDRKNSVNQYIGTPFGNRPVMVYQFYNSWMYKFSNEDLTNVAWERINGDTPLEAFQGYCVISAENEMNDGHMYTMSGQLVASSDVANNSILCRIKGAEGNTLANNENMLANSWMAPIKINAFNPATDFDSVSATIYIFNSGSLNQFNDKDITGSGPSQYSTYTIGTANDADVIPAMQAFSVFTYGVPEGQPAIRLNFNRLVYAPAVAGLTPQPNKAPRRVKVEREEANKLRLYVRAASGYGDMLYMWEHANFEEGYENGWDGGKMYGEGGVPQLYAITPDGKMAVNCVPNYEGVQIGFKAGEDDAVYTFTFEYEADAEVLYLHDKQTGEYTRIVSGNSYAFATSDKSEHARFELTRNAPQVATGELTTSGEEIPVHGTYKFIEDDKLLIYRNGRLYDATGVMLK